MRIALFTDQHFGPEARFGGKLRKLTQRAGQLTEAFVQRMNQVDKPDLVVNLGDVLEDESPALDEQRYRSFLRNLDTLNCPVLHVAGNHDTIHLSDQKLLELWGRSGQLYYSTEHAGLRFVVLRSVERRGRDVILPDEQLEWLTNQLAASEGPVLVLVHHPLSEMDVTGNRWFERAAHICHIANRKAVRQILEQSGKVRAVFNGHVHWNHLDVIGGIPYITLQSLTENVDDDAPGRPAAAHALVDLSDARLLVSIRGEQPAHYQFDSG